MFKIAIVAVAAMSATAVSASPQTALERFRAQQTQASTQIAQPEQIDPANWECARPIIQRNFSQSIEARELALRIADECTRPYRARSIVTAADQTFEQQERLTYTYKSQTFGYEIEGAIQQARRAASIKLN